MKDDLQLGKLKENCLLLKLYRKLRKMFLSPRRESNPQPSDLRWEHWCCFSWKLFIYKRGKWTPNGCKQEAKPRSSEVGKRQHLKTNTAQETEKKMNWKPYNKCLINLVSSICTGKYLPYKPRTRLISLYFSTVLAYMLKTVHTNDIQKTEMQRIILLDKMIQYVIQHHYTSIVNIKLTNSQTFRFHQVSNRIGR